jgi:hypothetical protein
MQSTGLFEAPGLNASRRRSGLEPAGGFAVIPVPLFAAALVVFMMLIMHLS